MCPQYLSEINPNAINVAHWLRKVIPYNLFGNNLFGLFISSNTIANLRVAAVRLLSNEENRPEILLGLVLLI